MTSNSLRPWPARNPEQSSTILLIEDEPFQAHARSSVLQRSFKVERVADAAEAMIKIGSPAFAQNVSLIVVGLQLPGTAGPSFVSELTRRVPNMPILVIGRPGEIAPDYTGEHVRFLPHHATSHDVLAGTRQMLREHLPKVA